jgi:hypothetical protein
MISIGEIARQGKVAKTNGLGVTIGSTCLRYYQGGGCGGSSGWDRVKATKDDVNGYFDSVPDITSEDVKATIYKQKGLKEVSTSFVARYYSGDQLLAESDDRYEAMRKLSFETTLKDKDGNVIGTSQYVDSTAKEELVKKLRYEAIFEVKANGGVVVTAENEMQAVLKVLDLPDVEATETKPSKKAKGESSQDSATA